MSGTTIHGTLRGADGPGLESATVTLISPQGRQLGRADTADDGRYELTVPEAGAYVLIGSAPGHRPQATTVVAADDPVAQDIVLHGSGGLTGTVRASADGRPVGGAMVIVTDAGGEVLATAKTDDDGDYVVDELPDGTLTLAVNAGGHRPAALPVEIGPRHTGRVDVTLSSGARLQGTVRVRGTGRPLRDARVTLVDAAGDVVATATTGSDGRYAFTDLAAGDYTLIAGGYPPAATPVGVNGVGGGGYDLRLGHPGE